MVLCFQDSRVMMRLDNVRTSATVGDIAQSCNRYMREASALLATSVRQFLAHNKQVAQCQNRSRSPSFSPVLPTRSP